MCISPLHIYNPTKDFIFGDAYKIDIPCQHCNDCRQKNQKEWQFRAQEEFMFRVKQGYNVYFLTLTYSNENMPYCSFVDENTGEEKFSFPCFSRSHINEFTTWLRHKLYNDYNIKDSSFIICSEYGKITARPHYHIVLCVHASISSFKLHKLIKDYWMQNYGFVFPRNFDGGYDSKGVYHKPFQVTDVCKAASYVSKYVCKDLAYTDAYPEFEILKNELKKIYKDSPTAENELAYKSVARCFPFLRVSKGFGACIEDKVKDIDDLLLGINDVSRTIHKRRQIPSYNKRRILFNRHYVEIDGKKCVRYTPKEEYKEYFRAEFDKKVKEFADSLKDFYEFPEGQSMYFDFLKTKRYDNNFSNCFADSYNYKNIATYCLCYRNRPLPDFIYKDTSVQLNWSDIQDYGRCTQDEICANGFDYIFSHKSHIKGVNDKLSPRRMDNIPKFNRLKQFKNFDRVLEYYFEYYNFYRENQSFYKQFKQDKEKAVRQMVYEVYN